MYKKTRRGSTNHSLDQLHRLTAARAFRKLPSELLIVKYKMKFIVLALFVCLLALAMVSAAPAEEGLVGDLLGSEQQYHNPQDPSSFFKLKKIKKLLFG
ncbi:uncharacterized protein LOC119649869 [Hermetia illucens]|nr:uncharacterized protein LOC119649869 [Hermetia illucens]